MSKVIAVGYVGVTGPDLNEWRTFATEVLGATVTDDSSDERLLLRIDERQWRISVEPGAGGLAFCGWELANEVALEELAKDLDANGISYTEDPELAKTRGVTRLIRCTDPGGNALELFYGANVPKEPFVSPTGARFVTELDGPGGLGLGHVVMTFPDEEEAKHFYFDILGFKLSDTINFPTISKPDHAVFAHVNPRHHSFAFVEVPGMPSVFNHFMLEVENLDMVGRALDVVNAKGLNLDMTFGKHTNDHMVSFYVRSPSGFSIEYGTGGRLIDDDVWTASSYDAASFWGHKMQPGATEIP